MVLKPRRRTTRPGFRLRVVLFLDGSQTQVDIIEESVVFEGRVVLDGSQTVPEAGETVVGFESRVTLVQAQAEANASACFFINSVYVKNPSCFPTKTGRVVVAETGLEPAASGL